MKIFDQRIAEIYRRSEEILANRKKRKKQILTICIPLALCTAIVIPFLTPKSKENKTVKKESVVMQQDASNAMNSMSESNSAKTKFTAIEATNLSQSVTYTNQAEIAAISSFVYSAMKNSEYITEQPDAEGNRPADNSGISEIQELWIYMYTDDGVEESYHLSESCILVDNKTGESYQLSGMAAESLSALLSGKLNLVDNITGKVFELE